MAGLRAAEGNRHSCEAIRILYMGTQTHLADFELVKNTLKRLKHEFGNSIKIDIIGISADALCEDWYTVLTPLLDSVMYTHHLLLLGLKVFSFDVGNQIHTSTLQSKPVHLPHLNRSANSW